MSEHTQESLKALSRVDLRREAVRILGIDNKVASNYKSDQLISMILESQDGGGKKKKDRPAIVPPKGKAAPKPEPEETNEEPEEPEEAPAPKGRVAAPDGMKEVVAHLKAIGKGMDENDSAVGATLTELERKLYILSGLVADVYKAVVDSEVEDRVNELDAEYTASTEEEGNE